MRVLLLSYEYPPLGGVLVDVVTGGDRDERTTELLWNGTAAEEGLLTVYRVKTRRAAIHQAGMRDALSYLRAALPEVRRRLREERYDLLHLLFSLPTGAMLPLLDLRQVPVVLSLSGSDVPGYDLHGRSLVRAHRFLRPVTRWIWRRADRVVAVCESLGHQARHTLPALRYSVIPNSVDLARFRPPLRRARPRPRFRCLAVARLVEPKGLADLIRAIGMLERGRFELEIVGAGPDEGSLRRLTADLGLDDRIVFSGSVHPRPLGRDVRERLRRGTGVRSPDRGQRRRGDPGAGAARGERPPGAPPRPPGARRRHPSPCRSPSAPRRDGPAEPGPG